MENTWAYGRNVRGVWFVFSNNHFQFLNNISRIFTHFFTHIFSQIFSNNNFQFLNHVPNGPLICTPWNRCWFLESPISSRANAMVEEIRHCSQSGLIAMGELRMSLTRSAHSWILWSSVLRPQQEENQIALATGQWKKMWQVDSEAWPHKLHDGSGMWVLRLIFCLVGKALEAILHSNILILSGALIFHNRLINKSLVMPEFSNSLDDQYADFTKNSPRESSTQINLSLRGLVGIGRDKTAEADSGSKIWWIRLSFQLWVSLSKSMDTIIGVLANSACNGLGVNPCSHGTQGSSQTLIEAPSPMR